MKTIGLLGGMSWESTTSYYTLLNRGIAERLGTFHSAKIAMVSVDFHPLEEAMRSGDWGLCARILSGAAKDVERAGADLLLLCTNTLHKVAPNISQVINIPFLHIIDAAAEHIRRANMHTVGLLGTKFTMEDGFYHQILKEEYQIEVVTPNRNDREIVHNIIFEELCQGKIRRESKKEYLRIIKELGKNGAQGIIEGCTEIPMLIEQSDTAVPLFDTTKIHAEKAIQTALNPSEH